jgi:hypothetical protein
LPSDIPISERDQCNRSLISNDLSGWKLRNLDKAYGFSMPNQVSFWLERSGSALELCAAIPATDQKADTMKSSLTSYESPNAFLSRLGTCLDKGEVSRIKSAVFHALGTLGQVYTIDQIHLSPEKLEELGLAKLN